MNVVPVETAGDRQSRPAFAEGHRLALTLGWGGKEHAMQIELTEQQRAVLAQVGEEALSVTDPATRRTYVLLSGDLYERLKAAMAEETWDVREAYPLMDAVAAQEGWNDPEMDSYNDLVERKQP